MGSIPDDVKNAETTVEDEMTEKAFLEAYKKKEYPKPSLKADIAVFRRVLMWWKATASPSTMRSCSRMRT